MKPDGSPNSQDADQRRSENSRKRRTRWGVAAAVFGDASGRIGVGPLMRRDGGEQTRPLRVAGTQKAPYPVGFGFFMVISFRKGFAKRKIDRGFRVFF